MDNFTDFFTRTALTEAITKVPYVPGQLASLFETRALPGTKLALEEITESGGTAVLTESPRGMPAQTMVLNRRKVHTFETKHYRKDGAIYADEVLNARALGANAAAQLIVNRRDETLAALRRDVDYHLEYLRVQTVLTPNNAFGNIGSDATIAFQTDATKVRGLIYSGIVAPIEAALAGAPYTAIDLYCSSGIWDDILENKSIKDSYLLSQEAQVVRGETREAFSFGGINFIRYRGAGSCAITADKAIAVPRGVPGMFIQAFAPADTLDSVGAGALGQPYYTAAYPIDGGNRGWHLEMQTNPVMVCTRPNALITVKMA